MHMNSDGQLEELNHQPTVSFADRVSSMIDGNQQEKTSLSQNAFLIHIQTQNVNFNDENCTIIYFRDITFGVLYE